ncbi:FAD-binding oxidoreductase [SAR202 cluster bacterium AD-804-J14_MRT_500m]|nr:FAD-binding oxidoreductase [SAR202 cluster bacterium AD-804-J14_MRT_500m]
MDNGNSRAKCPNACSGHLLTKGGQKNDSHKVKQNPLDIDQQKNNKPHVLVVGAGILGASIAFHLVSRGARVTVFDASTPGSGASSHSFAWINSFEKDPIFYHDLNRRSIDSWDRFERRLARDVGLRWGGDLRWTDNADSATRIASRVAELQTRGYPSKIITEFEMLQLEPGLVPGPVALCSFGEIDGQVDPSLVIDACLEEVINTGNTVHSNVSVTGLNFSTAMSSTPSVISVNTPNGEMLCDSIVIAAGVDTSRFADMAGIYLPQEESPGVTVRTNPLPRILENVAVIHAPALDGSDSGIHLKQGSNGVVMIGEGSQESLRRDDSDHHAKRLIKAASCFIPALVDAEAVPVPLGFRPMPADGLPVLGFSESVPNLYLAVMHSGVTLAPLVGELSAIEIIDGTRVEMLRPYRPERFI